MSEDRTLFWKSFRRSGNGMTPRSFAKLVGYRSLISDTEEKNGKPDKLKEVLTDEEKATLRHAIYGTWTQIASDMENNARVGQFKLTNLCAVETCLDADNLTVNAPYKGEQDGKEADKIVHRLIQQFDYSSVLLYICSIITLR